jgi:membrane-bound metal-dependent hydrolase YbcI (DUF457 family)
MASLGHIAVGMAASRVHDRTRDLHWLSALSWAALSMLPDADIVGLPLGVAYAAPWGHRGATHSMMFAVAVGFGIGVAAWSRRSRAPLVTWLLATAVLASHGLLAALAVRSHALLRAVAPDSGLADRPRLPLAVRLDGRHHRVRRLRTAVRVRVDAAAENLSRPAPLRSWG